MRGEERVERKKGRGERGMERNKRSYETSGWRSGRK
jgi:hypothetical protein